MNQPISSEYPWIGCLNGSGSCVKSKLTRRLTTEASDANCPNSNELSDPYSFFVGGILPVLAQKRCCNLDDAMRLLAPFRRVFVFGGRHRCDALRSEGDGALQIREGPVHLPRFSHTKPRRPNAWASDGLIARASNPDPACILLFTRGIPAKHFRSELGRSSMDTRAAADPMSVPVKPHSHDVRSTF
jgi:hypothetical protein